MFNKHRKTTFCRWMWKVTLNIHPSAQRRKQHPTAGTRRNTLKQKPPKLLQFILTRTLMPEPNFTPYGGDAGGNLIIQVSIIHHLGNMNVWTTLPAKPSNSFWDIKSAAIYSILIIIYTKLSFIFSIRFMCRLF